MLAPLGTFQLYEVAPATAEMLYVPLDVPERHNPVVGPVMVPGMAGVAVNVRVARAPVPQAFPGVTVTAPPVKEEDTFSTMEVVPCPEEMLVPAGAAQV